ncbi:abhydrolase domain-containing [Micractinium conductrix]|uniref:Abhydrolase domain-containing n=1 Tax=Micractinium conductrix TaxID=554055 RepID=A0A2P6VKP8_9CHLO|nr:abhydrolase domain-containing [Micractinium conductrix]|eukprot:PSC74655.1 abhydrolase domain-containing [Micractinium conductrix]
MGHFIALPGAQPAVAGARAAMEILMGQSEVAANVFSLGIGPLMSAYFFLAAANVVPPIRKHFAQLREAGPQGRDTYTGYITILFGLFACWEGTSLARCWLPASIAASSAAAKGWSAGVVAWAVGAGKVTWMVAVLTAGSAVCKLITQLVEQNGLGDGTGLLIALGVAVNYAHFLADAAAVLAAAPPRLWAVSLVALLCCLLTGVALWAQGVQLRLPATFYQERHSETGSPKGHQAQRHPLLELLNPHPAHHTQQAHREEEEEAEAAPSRQYFPLQLSPSGARSLLFANFWVALLQPPLSWLGVGNPFASSLGFAALVLVVEGISFADMTPRQISQYLASSDAGLRGIAPGIRTISYLAARRRQLKLLNATLLAGLSLAARGVDAVAASLVGVPAGCLSLLLLASTVASAVRQVESLAQPEPFLTYEIVRGALVRYSSAGGRPPPTAVLVHGILGKRQNMLSFARRLVEGFPHWQVVVADLRCHGDSAAVSNNLRGTHSLESAAADLIRLLSALKLFPEMLIGHSFGGKVVLQMTRSWAMGPARRVPRPVQVWVLDALPGEVRSGDMGGADRPADLISTLQGIPLPVPSRHWLVGHLESTGFSRQVATWAATNLAPSAGGAGGLTWGFDLAGIAQMFRSYETSNLWPLLTSPADGLTLSFVKAERSTFRWGGGDEARIRELGHAVHTLPNSGHWVHTDNPDGLFDILAPSFGASPDLHMQRSPKASPPSSPSASAAAAANNIVSPGSKQLQGLMM